MIHQDFRIKVKRIKPKNPKIPKKTLLEKIMKCSTIEERSLFVAVNKGNQEEVKRILESMEKRTKGKGLREMQERLLRIIVENRFARKQMEFLNMERAAQILCREKIEDGQLIGELLTNRSKNVKVGALIGIFERVERSTEFVLDALKLVGATVIEIGIIQNRRASSAQLRENIKLEIVRRVAQGVKVRREEAANDTEADN